MVNIAPTWTDEWLKNEQTHDADEESAAVFDGARACVLATAAS